MKRSFLVAGAVALVATSAIASHTIANSAKSGQRVLVTDMFWSGDRTGCTPVDMTYTLVTPPANGTVTQRKAREKLNSAALNISPPHRCEGSPLVISYVYYQSKKGFTGTDQFTVRWTRADGETREKSYRVTVE